MKQNKSNVVLIRHGQSLWNQQSRFTGWQDIDLSEQGKQEAKQAGYLLKKQGLVFDIACVSFLKRAIRTLWILLDELDQMWIPVIKSWRLNERHYGSLTGQSKKDIAQKYGAKQVQLWRRDYKTKPPLWPSSENNTLKDRRYKSLIARPLGESLLETQQRVLPFWEQKVLPQLKEGKTILITALGNSLRALIKHIECLNDKEIAKVEVPTARPLGYTLCQKTFKVINKSDFETN